MISLIDAKHFALLQRAVHAQSRGLPFQVRAIFQTIKGICAKFLDKLIKMTVYYLFRRSGKLLRAMLCTVTVCVSEKIDTEHFMIHCKTFTYTHKQAVDNDKNDQ